MVSWTGNLHFKSKWEYCFGGLCVRVPTLDFLGSPTGPCTPDLLLWSLDTSDFLSSGPHRLGRFLHGAFPGVPCISPSGFRGGRPRMPRCETGWRLGLEGLGDTSASWRGPGFPLVADSLRAEPTLLSWSPASLLAHIRCLRHSLMCVDLHTSCAQPLAFLLGSLLPSVKRLCMPVRATRCRLAYWPCGWLLFFAPLGLTGCLFRTACIRGD